MRISLYFTLFICLCCTSLAAQTTESFNRFMKGGGVHVLSRLAHPTNDFIRAEWTNYEGGNQIVVEIYSKDLFDGNEELTVVTLYRQGYFFTGVKLNSDTDFPSGFMALALIKEMLNDEIRKYNTKQKEIMGALEKHFNRSVIDMNAFQISCVLLSALYYAY